jgi:hypothetical protein
MLYINDVVYIHRVIIITYLREMRGRKCVFRGKKRDTPNWLVLNSRRLAGAPKKRVHLTSINEPDREIRVLLNRFSWKCLG